MRCGALTWTYALYTNLNWRCLIMAQTTLNIYASDQLFKYEHLILKHSKYSHASLSATSLVFWAPSSERSLACCPGISVSACMDDFDCGDAHICSRECKEQWNALRLGRFGGSLLHTYCLYTTVHSDTIPRGDAAGLRKSDATKNWYTN